MEVVSLITKQLLKPFKKDQKILKEETYKHCLYCKIYIGSFLAYVHRFRIRIVEA